MERQCAQWHALALVGPAHQRSRTETSALPVQEATGLPYASKITATDSTGKTVPVMHACGHDMHVPWLIGAATLFAKSRGSWKGTLMVVFQPAEETGQGAQAMIDDGLFRRFPKPVVVLGQHVMAYPTGVVAGRPGATTSSADSLQIRLFGRGAHGSMPEASIDPVVTATAASTVLRLQTVVSRDLSANEAAVVTIGVLQAGTKENVIPDDAIIRLNVPTFDEGVRKSVFPGCLQRSNCSRSPFSKRCARVLFRPAFRCFPSFTTHLRHKRGQGVVVGR